MWYTKLIFYFSTLILIVFPMAIGMADSDQLPKEREIIEAKYLSDNQVQLIDSILQRRLKRNGFRGTALVAYKDQIIMTYANGYSNYKTKQKIDIHSNFQLASVSKSFTATSVMILKENGLLNYDDLVIKHIPEFPYDHITIRQLLQHTAGLQNYMYLVDNYWKNDSVITNEDVLDLLIEHNLPLNNWPGRRFTYSNTAYAMLALLVERVSGQRFEQFVHDHIFVPSGMNNTYTYRLDILDTVSNRVFGYNRKGRRLYRYDFEPNDLILGDKSIISNVNDLFLYQKALNSYKIVSKETLEEAYTKGHTNSRYKREFNYGFGWRIKNSGRQNLIYHNGLWHGFVSTLTREIDHDITIVMLNNTSAGISALKTDLINISIREINKLHLSEEPIEEVIATTDVYKLSKFDI
jgi:CubicO group peptidase (beta-lactamase class C family)